MSDEGNANWTDEAAEKLRQDAEQAYGTIRERGLMGFFSFDHFYFPVIARYVFIAFCILGAVGMLLGVLGGILAVVTGNILAGIGAMIGSVVGCAISLFAIRLWFELFLLGFKIYEGVKKMSDKCAD